MNSYEFKIGDKVIFDGIVYSSNKEELYKIRPCIVKIIETFNSELSWDYFVYGVYNTGCCYVFVNQIIPLTEFGKVLYL